MIKRFLLSNTFLFLALLVYGQTDPVRESTYHFTIKERELTGPGADTLKAYISKSQFFLLGEEHDMTELQMLTADLMPFLKSSGYRHFALEIGSLAAERLSSIYRKKESLMKFNSRYYKHFNSGPFGFFDGKEEEVFLNAALDNNFKLWGIDYESHGAPLYILDELYAGSQAKPILKNTYQKAAQYIIDEYAKDLITIKYPIYSKMLHSAELAAFFQAVPANRSNQKLMEELILSWKIRDEERNNKWYARVENMKKSFIRQYKDEAKKKELPKVFIKLGAVHTARGTSSSGFPEVGNTIYELANYSNTQAFSIISFARYRKDEQGNISDLLEPEDEALLKYTNKDSWSLINLKQLNEARLEGKINLSKEVIGYIQKYDMMLIPPATTRMQPNFIR
ncbi:hypothetical protein [Pedobacter caeni]|uniref:Erythromycin esterase homolog n=1 Tax=Pedobacter caeni TaxID=288992 RepID=A0A1M5L4K7_9SPHI|nr:hypothetical protein [Pedobacter caeni]SHG59921.1 hypothetical protein SAMN04488522_106210 [Pedobacter caeni]